MNSNAFPQMANDEVSIKEILIKLKYWVNYFKIQWKIILLMASIGAIIGYVYVSFQKPQYTATLTFALEEEKTGGGLSGALGLANSLGFDIGGSSGGGAFSGSNLMELMRSRTLVEKALLSPVMIKNQNQSLADYFIQFTHMSIGWDKHLDLKDIHFNPMINRNKFNLQQDSILGILYQRIAGQNGMLSVLQKDKKVSIITIEVKSEDELFAKKFAETIAKVVSEFYIDTKSKKAKENYDILQKQTDSIRNELNAAMTGVAAANDNTYNLNPAFNMPKIPSAKRQVDVQANTAILTQLVTNLEMAKVALRKETPLIQVIDTPILPLLKTRASKLNALFIGFFIGSILTMTILLFRKLTML